LPPLLALFRRLDATGVCPYARQYERVQHCGAAVPRLYLAACVAGAAAKDASDDASSAPPDGSDGAHARAHELARWLLTDVSALSAAAQHPLRGLLLRAHLDLAALGPAGRKGLLETPTLALDNLSELAFLWARLRASAPPREHALEALDADDAALSPVVAAAAASAARGGKWADDPDGWGAAVLPGVVQAARDAMDPVVGETVLRAAVLTPPGCVDYSTAYLDGALPSIAAGVVEGGGRRWLLDLIRALSTMGTGVGAHRLLADLLPLVADRCARTGAPLNPEAAREALEAVTAGASEGAPGVDVIALGVARLRFARALSLSGSGGSGDGGAVDVLASVLKRLTTLPPVGGLDADAREPLIDLLVDALFPPSLSPPSPAVDPSTVLASAAPGDLASLLPPADRRALARRLLSAARSVDARISTVDAVAGLMRLVSPLLVSVETVDQADEDTCGARRSADGAAGLAGLADLLKSDFSLVQTAVDAALALDSPSVPALAAMLPPLAARAISLGVDGSSPLALQVASALASAAGGSAALAGLDVALSAANAEAVRAGYLAPGSPDAPRVRACLERALLILEDDMPTSAGRRVALSSLWSSLAMCGRALSSEGKGDLADALLGSVGRLARRADQIESCCRAAESLSGVLLADPIRTDRALARAQRAADGLAGGVSPGGDDVSSLEALTDLARTAAACGGADRALAAAATLAELLGRGYGEGSGEPGSPRTEARIALALAREKGGQVVGQ